MLHYAVFFALLIALRVLFQHVKIYHELKLKLNISILILVPCLYWLVLNTCKTFDIPLSNDIQQALLVVFALTIGITGFLTLAKMQKIMMLRGNTVDSSNDIDS